MASRITRSLIATACLLAFGSSHAASLAMTPNSISPAPGQVTLDLVLDLTGVTTIGGAAELVFSGGLSFGSFTPSAFFNSKDTSPTNLTDFTGFGDPPGDNPFEILIGDFNGFTGNNSLGLIAINVTGPGRIDVIPSPDSRFGGFLDITGSPIAGFDYGLGGVEAIPLPATAWLFLAGMGAAATRLRRRK